ncbi:aldehyde dehydrogenase family protein [Arthrobacter echini]|uniref:aldehyde dehydrogenase family protein n=1 Tax=Arthrobacter echini TaxID=1529066 RepID=UPI001B3BC9D5|nr:aldehyde dehydrogenase family protein [Arthrobacter echini]
MTRYEKARHWIDGQWLDSGRTGMSIDPATGEEIGEYAEATADDAQHAVDVAKRVFDTTDWKRDRRLRARVLNKMATTWPPASRHARKTCSRSS